MGRGSPGGGGGERFGPPSLQLNGAASPAGDGGGEAAAGRERLLGHSRVRVVVEEGEERGSELGPPRGNGRASPSQRAGEKLRCFQEHF